jgi:hypothetical protein
MASANRPERVSQPSDQRDTCAPQPDPAEKTKRELLEQVVAETIAAGNVAVSPQEREALLAVAHRHRGRPLEHEPVVPELVLAILQLRFNRLDLDTTEWQEMAVSVAATLLDAPDVRAHLQAYWDRLGQALP